MGWAQRARASRTQSTSECMHPLQILLLASGWSTHLVLSPPCRGTTTVDGAGFGIDRPAELSKEDDEYEAFRKRMMLAYRFRPNPLVRVSPAPTTAPG